MQIRGVPAWGIVDSGADITIVGKQLFQTIAAVSKLKKRDCKKPDKIPKTYDRKPFTLHGKLELDIMFAERKMTTPVYVKMDPCDQLLLSEGVCRQLRVLQYYPFVLQCSGEDDSVELAGKSKVQSSEATTMVPTVQVRLLQSQAVPPLQRVAVEVKTDSSGPPHSLMLEPLHPMKGVLVEPSLLHIRGGTAFLEVKNQTGFTQHLEEGLELGETTEATVFTACEVEDKVPEVDDQTASLTLDQDEMTYLRRVSQGNQDEWKMTRVPEDVATGSQAE